MSKTFDRCLEHGEPELATEEAKKLWVSSTLVYGTTDNACYIIQKLSDIYTNAGYDKDVVENMTKELSDITVMKDFESGKAAVEGTKTDLSHEDGIKLIIEAAKAGLSEAIEYIASYYSSNGNNNAACTWFEILYSYLKCRLGEEHSVTDRLTC